MWPDGVIWSRISEPFKHSTQGSVRLGESRYGWVGTRDVLGASGGQMTLAELQALGILAHSKQTQAAAQLHAALHAEGLSVQSVTHSNSLAACLAMALDGMGVRAPVRQCRRRTGQHQRGAIPADPTSPASGRRHCKARRSDGRLNT